MVSELKPAWQAGVADKVRKLPGRGTQMTNWVGTQTLSQDELYSSKRSSSPQCLGMGRYLETGMLQMIRLGWVPWCGLQYDNDTTYKILTKGGNLSQHGSLYLKVRQLGSWGRKICVFKAILKWDSGKSGLQSETIPPPPKKREKNMGERGWFGQRHGQWKNSTWKRRQN